MNRELESAAYERRRLLAAVLGRPTSPVVRPLVGGLLVSALLAAVEVARRLW